MLGMPTATAERGGSLRQGGGQGVVAGNVPTFKVVPQKLNHIPPPRSFLSHVQEDALISSCVQSRPVPCYKKAHPNPLVSGFVPSKSRLFSPKHPSGLPTSSICPYKPFLSL
ncbi:hypothetical protein BGZ61DRAFT_220164 [Ilyonectria robusta]|uniref:uncharacterized protein n=1 Tax=Ilyonectria robusta TaxID=1079257 RepID=UPI001E8E3622|nr:uncharacterized protein BGZ61DRAFT_220164 [Ilyonectria robusta]KAH8706386.1 hypothetical protein BGZ61DRAFT_220164 [Ilyonectria robusta]